MRNVTLVTLHFSRQVPIISDVHHNIACRATTLEIIRNTWAVDTAHQVLNVAFPFVTAD